ncbi:MAG: hypothetical protein RBT16_12040 [Desulfococcus multivorans]|uniref:hypothetical protein n=1 Tax=Desulfococcus sp. TaxID=2025834 RepID=UPI002A40F25A|nr:hypothetical protein [Desulfococcus multivorans]
MVRLVRGMAEIYGRRYSPDALKLVMLSLDDYSYDEVREAIAQVLKKSRFCPTPMEIIQEINALKAARREWGWHPPASLQQAQRRLFRQEELADAFLRLSPKEQAELKQAFLSETNAFIRRRSEKTEPERLARNTSFRLFLEDRWDGEDRRENAVSETAN